MLTDSSQNVSKYVCEKCNIVTNNKKDFNKHILTSKHQKKTGINKSLTDSSQSLTEFPESLAEHITFQCKQCDKKYNSRVGLWYHKKKCKSIKEIQIDKDNMDDIYSDDDDDEEHSAEHSSEYSKTKFYNIPPTNNEIIEIMKAQMIDNQEFKKFMMDQQKQIMELALKSSITNTNTINANSNCNNNNTFNLQFFLNEK